MTEIRTISALSNVKLHRICGTEDVGSFIRPQQRNYASHVKRMSHERAIKQLIFNDDRGKTRKDTYRSSYL